jgi:WhiB family transcriptional regulator, redox-sensing transcriptional regulator
MTAPDSRAGWWSRAACLASDPELFFPISSPSPGLNQVRRAKAICARCEIQQGCLDYALTAGPIHGIWGGTTEEERRRLRNGYAGGGTLPQRAPSARATRQRGPAAIPHRFAERRSPAQP